MGMPCWGRNSKLVYRMLTFSGNLAGFWKMTAPSLWVCGLAEGSPTVGRPVSSSGDRGPPLCQSSCSWGISPGASHGHHAKDAGSYGATHHSDGWAAEDHLATAGTDVSSTVTCNRVCPYTNAREYQARSANPCRLLLWEAGTLQDRLSEMPVWSCQEDTVTPDANSASPASACTSSPITTGRSSRGQGFSVEPRVSSSTLGQQREGSGVDDRLITRTVGKQPLVEAVIGGIKVPCLIDTGSQVSMVSESLFKTHLEPVMGTSPHDMGWLRLTAANGLGIPYIGIADLDVEVGGVLVKDRGVVITRQAPTTVNGQEVHGLLRSNILQHVPKYKQLLGDSHHTGFAWLTGRDSVLVPAYSECTLAVIGPSFGRDALFEPLASPIPGNFLAKRGLVNAKGPMFVQVMNLGSVDVWLKPRTKLGTHTRAAEQNLLKVKVTSSGITASVNEVTGTSSPASLPEGLDLSTIAGQPSKARRRRSSLSTEMYSKQVRRSRARAAQWNIISTWMVAMYHGCHTGMVPLSMFEEFVQHLRQLLAKKIIRKSSSQYASPVVLVRKKSGGLRMCVDFKLLNRHVIRDNYPLPRIEQSMDALKGTRVFSTMDLQSAYYQVEVAEEDKAKTAFCTPVGIFEFNRMPFGLSNAPATYKRLMQQVFQEELFSEVLVYLDDLLLYSQTVEEHMDQLEKVFGKLRREGLRLELFKYKFFQERIHNLGHEDSIDGIATEEDKLRAVHKWPVPTTTRDVRSFLGFCSYYRRYIKGFAQIAKPLHDLVALCESGGPV